MTILKNKKLWCYVEILALLFITFSPLISTLLKMVISFVLIAISFWSLSKENNGDFPLENTILIAMLCFALAMIWDVRNILRGQSYSLVNFLYPIYFLCGYLVAKRYSKTKFYDAVEKITFVLAILSLIGMAVYYIRPSLIRSFPTYVQNGNTHRTILFFNYLFDDGWMAVRNSGFAWEPGAFQILLNIAFQIALQKYEGKKLFARVCVYVLAIILTRSTIGYVVLAVNIICLLKKHKNYVPFLITAAVLSLAIIIPEIEYQLEYKLMGSGAFSARFRPLVNAIKYAWYMPLGLGSTGYDAVYVAENLGSFDCYTQILLRFGYPLLIYVIAKLANIFRRDNIYMGLILIISFLSEPVWGSLLFIIMYYIEDKKTVEVADGEISADQPA